MVVVRSALVLLLMGEFLLAQTTPPDVYHHQCSAEHTTDSYENPVAWPATNSSANVHSSPLCLDGDHLLVTRNCTPDGWEPDSPPSCPFSQISFEDSDHCPLGYEQLSTNVNPPLCILLTEPQPWTNMCLNAGTSSTLLDLDEEDRDLVLDALLQRGVHRVWMPAKRWVDFGPIAWQLPGRHYGDSVEFDDDIERDEDNEIQERGCLSLNVTNRGRSGGDEDCDTAYPILCVYNEKRPLLQLACPDGMVTTRYEGYQDVCFSLKRIKQMKDTMHRRQQSFTWVESECRGELYSLDSVGKTVIFQSLAERFDLGDRDRCLFGVLPNVLIETPMDWAALSNFTSFVNWAAPGQPGNIVTADRHGKWHWSDDFTCITCQTPMALHTPHINLKFFDEHLFAVVYNIEYFWKEDKDEDEGFKCFTNSDDELIRSVEVEGKVWSGVIDNGDLVPTERRDKTRTVYKLRTYGSGPGYYWCRGHAMPDFKLIESASIVAYRKIKGDVFAVKVRTDCTNCRDYFQDKCVKGMARRFRAQLNRVRRAVERQVWLEFLSIENVRVMQICDIDVDRNVSHILFHVTVSLDGDFDDSEEDLLEMSERMLQLYKMRNYLKRILVESNRNASLEFQYVGLNNTEFCLPESISSDVPLHWSSAKIGEMTAPRELCLMHNGLPARRQCVGDFIHGGAWLQEATTNASDCDERIQSPITRRLYNIDRLYTSVDNTSAVIQDIFHLISTANKTEVIPADLYYLGRVLHSINHFNGHTHGHQHNNASTSGPASLAATIQQTTATTQLQRRESENIFAIYNRLMFLNENTTRLAAALNATNMLLEALDHIVNCMSSDNLHMMRNSVNLTENRADGTIAMISPKLLVYVIDPVARNFSGLALMRRTASNGSEHSDDFLDYDIRLLRANQSVAGLLEEERLEIASFVPARLLGRLNETWHMADATANTSSTTPVPCVAPPVKIVVTVYYNDLLFQENRHTTYAKSGGKIISVSIPGYGPILPDLLPIFIKPRHYNNSTNASDVCGYWDFESDTWSKDGCEFGGSSTHANPTVICTCSHLTHFAYLVMGTYFQSIPGEVDVVHVDSHQDVLDMITLLGCCLSLAGIVGIVITAIVFPSWREKPGTKVLLHLSASIALQMVLLCFVNTEGRSMSFYMNQQWAGCVAMGALLHYSVLVAFMWMLITAYLQFMRYVVVLGPGRTHRFFLKASLFGWGIPTIPVCVVLIAVPDSYIPNLDQIEQGICYPTGYSLYLGVIVPMGIIVLANLVIFIMVIYNIVRVPDNTLRTSSDRDLSMAQLRLSVLLFFLLGLTWIFGLCASTQAGLVFSYLFCLTATLQGFVLFVYFIVLDPITRNLWSKWMKRYLGCARHDDGLK